MMVRLQYQHVLMETMSEQKENNAIRSKMTNDPLNMPSESFTINKKQKKRGEKVVSKSSGQKTKKNKNVDRTLHFTLI